jgi:hypothetical protein
MSHRSRLHMRQTGSGYPRSRGLRLFFVEPRPKNLLIFPAHRDCNCRVSTSDEYARNILVGLGSERSRVARKLWERNVDWPFNAETFDGSGGSLPDRFFKLGKQQQPAALRGRLFLAARSEHAAPFRARVAGERQFNTLDREETCR